MADPIKHSSAAALVISWLIVGLPAAWGVEQTGVKSMDLFKEAKASPTTMPTKAMSVSPTTMPTLAPTTMPTQK